MNLYSNYFADVDLETIWIRKFTKMDYKLDEDYRKHCFIAILIDIKLTKVEVDEDLLENLY